MKRHRLRGTWAWTFDTFPGIAPSRQWGTLSNATVTLPNGGSADVTALFFCDLRVCRLQLTAGTPADQFPSAIVIRAGGEELRYDEPRAKQTFGLGDARDYGWSSGNSRGANLGRPKLTGVETDIELHWDSPVPEPKPEPPIIPARPPLIMFDPDRHALLRDLLHSEWLPQDYYDEFLRGLAREQIPIEEVQMPDWPPVSYSPLGLVMSLDDGRQEGQWWDRTYWTGMQPVVSTQHWQGFVYPTWGTYAPSMEKEVLRGDPISARYDTIARYVARAIARTVPFSKRLAYKWQVPEFDPDRHVLTRDWIESRGLDYVQFLRTWIPDLTVQLGFNPIVWVANPDNPDPHQEGGYQPKRRTISVDHVGHVLEDYELACAGQPRKRRPSIVKSTGKPRPQTTDTPTAKHPVIDGAVVYDGRTVATALAQAFGGTLPRMFGGAMSDSAIVAMTPDGLDAYLAWSQVDRDQYIADAGNRNYDCDNFADSFRADVARKFGLNCVGIVWGNGHAWNFVVVANGDTPRIVFVEPQADDDDAIVTELKGLYAIDQRCELYL